MTSLRTRMIARLSLVEKGIWINKCIAFILFNIAFWIERWSVSGDGWHGLSNYCYDVNDAVCCQSFDDRDLKKTDKRKAYKWS